MQDREKIRFGKSLALMEHHIMITAVKMNYTKDTMFLEQHPQ